MNLLAKKLNIHINYISGPTWNEFIDMMKNKELDILLNIIQTPERKKFLNFTSPYKKLNYYIHTRDDKKVSSIKELNGRTIAQVKGYVEISLLKEKYPNITIMEGDNMEEVVKAVAFGKADALLGINPIINNTMKRLLISNIIPSAPVEFSASMELCIATHKNNSILRDILEKAKRAITSKDMKKLDNKWLGQTSPKVTGIFLDLTLKNISKK
jgi:polar amino acid transport system substrate-binding protein